MDEDLGWAERDAGALAGHDPAALADLVARYQNRLYRYLLRLVRDPTEADDLFQQTWLNVVRQMGRYDPQRSFDTWLFAIAHNLAMDALRRRRGENIDQFDAAAPGDALEHLIASERNAALATAMESLHAVAREALTLRFEEGMKLEEMAEVMHAPLSTVKSRVQRALLALRTRVRKEDLR